MKRDPNCTLCRLHKTAQYVCLLGKGPRPTDIMVVGEAPGEREDDSGTPFVGRAGQVLESALDSIDLDREDVFITNAVSCRPPNNRTPTKAEIRTCSAWLKYQINKVQPKYVLLLGNVPLQSITGEAGIKKMRGKPFERDGIIYLPTFHPAYVMRDPRVESVFYSDLMLFRKIIDFGGIPRERSLNYRVVDSEAAFEEMIADLYGSVSADLETTGLYPWAPDAQIVSAQFATARGQWVWPAEQANVFPRELQEEMVERITEALDDCFTIFHNGKFDCLWMWVRYGVRWHIDFDTMLAHYALDENGRHGLKELAQEFYSAPDWDVDIKTKQTWNPRNAKYGAHDVYYTRKLRFTLGKMLEDDFLVNRVFRKILMPCANLFVEVEYDGIYIDVPKMGAAEKYLRAERAKAKEQLDRWGKGVNWNSPKQIGKLFFEDLKIKPLDKTKTGANSTSESVLMRLDHPAAGALLAWRAAEKQLSGFIEGWKPFLVNDYLHPSFKLHGTVTGRLSCENPNLQQVPRDKRIRSLITAPEGWTLIEVDLSQIELRITAELSGDPAMMHAFRTGIDVHWLTAIKEIARGAGMKDEVIETAFRYAQKRMSYAESIETLLKMGPDTAAELMEEWKELRKKAKAINFGYVFGMWWKKFKIYARDNYGVELDDKQAQESRISFFETYASLAGWHDRQRRFARMNGYVRSLSGRKRRLPDAQSSRDTPERAEALRQAINSPVQSFANDINLMAAIQLRQEYPRTVVKICGTVHDACLVRVRNDYVGEVTTRLLEIMTGPDLLQEFDVQLSVPIEADAKVGPWGAGVKLEKWLKEAA